MSKNQIIQGIYDEMISLKRKFACFFILMILFNFLFWYYSSSFCAVFKNTQIPLIKDTIIDYVTYLLTTIAIKFFICGPKFLFLKKHKKCLYKIIKCLEDFIYNFKILLFKKSLFNKHLLYNY